MLELSPVSEFRSIPCQSDHDRLRAAEVERALCSTGYPALRAVTVNVHGSIVYLSGRVPSYHLKQLAQAAAGTISLISEVRNELEVVSLR